MRIFPRSGQQQRRIADDQDCLVRELCQRHQVCRFGSDGGETGSHPPQVLTQQVE